MTITHTYDPALYVLVPREPTPQMIEAFHDGHCFLAGVDAFIAAAPPPPAPPTDDARMREFGEALNALERTASATCWTLKERATVLALYAAALQSQADATDAARYRWLRDNNTDDGLVLIMKTKHIRGYISPADNIENYIDLAISAARGAK